MDLEKELAGFSKHIPKVLRQQLICELVNDYIQKRDGSNLHAEVKIQPTIQRFYGALLFVDISGFTVLSQKLDVESLKNNINNYFKKMLEVVDKWGGDVIKFAGDALYIIWPINVHFNHIKSPGSDAAKKASSNSLHHQEDLESNPQFQLEMKRALEKAVACGLEICSSCGRHEVFIGESNERQSNQLGVLGRLLPNFTSFLTTTKVSPTTTNHTISYLDVHAGVSMGLMAAIDIGYEERWEFFILGDPIAGVAAAEASAEKGDVAMCPKSHTLLHPTGDPQRPANSPKGVGSTKGTVEFGDVVCACGCIRNAAGSYIVKMSGGEAPKGVKALRRSRSKSKLEEAVLQQELALQDGRLVEAICTDIEKAFVSSQMLLKKHFVDGHSKYRSKPGQAQIATAIAKKSAQNLHNHNEIEKEFLHVLKETIHDHFVTWMKSALVVETMFHVHDASRHDYTPPHKSLTGEYFTVLGNIFHAVTDHPSVASDGGYRHPLALEAKFQDSSDNSELDTPVGLKLKMKGLKPEIADSYDSPRLGGPLNRSSPAPMDLSGGGNNSGGNAHEATSASELRSVTIMFIKIDGMDMQLTIDPNRSKGNSKAQNVCYETFGFLDRTDNEITSDEMLLNKLQSCISVLGEAIYSCGGQMRQFMVDDKGTVCIATFGLRGAVMEDNAASAIETGLKIIRGLQRIDIISSIGITTGKAYCGQVGSPLRHEFAVMGPSVNLSARLMCKAGPNSIMCDHETAIRDRSHEFNKLSAVVAKGYAQPVMTYSPKSSANAMIQQMMAPSEGGSTRILALSSSSGSSLRVRVDFKTAERDQSKFSMRVTNKSNNDLPPGERLWRLLETDFFIPNANETFLGEGVAEHSYVKLHGRKQEMAKIFSGLFTKRRSGSVFNTEDTCRIVALCGPGGIGKSSIATAFAAKLFHASKKDNQFNVFIMKNRPSSLHSNIVFNTWRPIIAELCRSVFRLMGHHQHGNNGSGTKRGKAQGDVNESILAGFREISGQMPKELSRYGPLLTRTFGFNNDRIEEEDRMDQRTMMLKCCELMAGVITVSSKMMKKMILIVMYVRSAFVSVLVVCVVWSRGTVCLVWICVCFAVCSVVRIRNHWMPGQWLHCIKFGCCQRV